jgi:flavodoxin I
MQKSTLIIFGSSLGNTRFVAEKLEQLLPGSRLMEASAVSPEIIANYRNLILGTSTWGVGLLQDDFDTFMELLQQQKLEGKTIALFGLGDQQNYPDSFCDGMGKIYELLQNKGLQFIGEWPADEYDFTTSRATKGDDLVGLALDEDNEPDLTDYRLKNWVKLIAPLLQ